MSEESIFHRRQGHRRPVIRKIQPSQIVPIPALPKEPTPTHPDKKKTPPPQPVSPKPAIITHNKSSRKAPPTTSDLVLGDIVEKNLPPPQPLKQVEKFDPSSEEFTLENSEGQSNESQEEIFVPQLSHFGQLWQTISTWVTPQTIYYFNPSVDRALIGLSLIFCADPKSGLQPKLMLMKQPSLLRMVFQ